MTMTLTGTGGLFTRLGVIASLLNSLNTYRLSTIKTKFDNINAQFLSTDQFLMSTLYPGWAAFKTAGDKTAQLMAGTSASTALAQQTIIQMVHDDQGLQDTSLKAAVVETIRQMTASANSIKFPVTSVTSTAAGANTGDGTIIISKLYPTGVQLDYPFAETLYARCIKDSQAVSGAAPLGKEVFQILGEQSISDFTSQDYPLGSGTNLNLTVVTSDDDAVQTTNLLAKSDMEDFTSNTPNNWILDTGISGTNVLKSTSPVYRGTGALQLAGTGGAAGSIYQTFNTGGQSTAKVAPLTTYAVNCWARVDVTPAAGVLSLALTDGTGTIINDANSAANNLTLALTGVSTTWVKLNGFFRTPANLPASVRFRIRLSTDITSGKSCFVDDVVMQPATQLYQGGPFVGGFSGATKFVQGLTPQTADLFTLSATNDLSSKWALFLDRAFGLRALNLQFPSVASGGETISDALIA